MSEQDDLDLIESGLIDAIAGETKPKEEIAPFEFDEIFQTQVAAHAVRNNDFMRKCGHLVRPEYFENIGEASVVNIGLDYFKTYGVVPTPAAFVNLIKDRVTNKMLKGELLDSTKKAFKAVYSLEITDGQYIAEKVAEFCRQQAVSSALLASVDMLGKKQFDKIEKNMQTALDIGLNEDGEDYDYYARIEERTEVRLDKVAGKAPPSGVTTGNIKFDDLLYHRGWGKKELSVLLGGAKAGKTTALINFARMASMAGKNVLYVTLEVAREIIADRLDASFTDTEMKRLSTSIRDVESKIFAMKRDHKFGKLQIHEYPTGTMTPSMLHRLIDRYKSKGVVFDMVVLDYADIAAPNFRSNDAIENSKSVYVDLRAIAQAENVAMLTATQTNRDGFKSAVAKAEHVAEDFNKIRIADLIISINKTEEEAAKGEARLYFAASRNQESGFTVFIKQEMAKMRFMTSILRVE